MDFEWLSKLGYVIFQLGSVACMALYFLYEIKKGVRRLRK